MRHEQRNKALALALNALALAVLACNTGNPDRKLNLYPSSTPTSAVPTQTAIVMEIVNTVVVQITTTPVPTSRTYKCISAVEAVYLRPSPSTENYPIKQLEKGVEVVDIGGKIGEWIFVEVNGVRGWVNQKYMEECR